MATKKKPTETLTMLMDRNAPWEIRKRLFMHLIMDGNPDADLALQQLCDAAAAGNAESMYNTKLKELQELLAEMEKGPLRKGIFLKMLNGNGSVRRAEVALLDGETAYTVVPDTELGNSLRCGDVVHIEGQARALLGRDPAGITIGEEARLERVIDDTRVEVTLRDHESHIFRAAQTLVDKLKTDEVKPGAKLLVCPRRFIAFDAVPAADGLSHYWYLVRDPVPDVKVDRDIGSPPIFIDDVLDHVRTEMNDPQVNRRYRLRRAMTKLLTGVSGSGKSLSIQAIWRRIYEVMSEVTGVPIDKLPPRVVRLRSPRVLSKWLGESDQRLDRFFDEVEQLAADKFVAPDGTEWELPVLGIGEEIDALARSRGEGDPVYDRIQTTALERLDVNCQKFKDYLVIFLFTTNVPHLVDPAFLRRAGGTIERFDRLERRAFPAVLLKHLHDLPFHEDCGRGEQAERRVTRDVTDWLYSLNGHDSGQVALTFVGSATPVLKYRRDFLTGALVDRAVQQAAAEACRAERLGCDQPGINSELVIAAFNTQIRSIVDQLTRENAGNYLTLPDAVRVNEVHRIEQPSVMPFELERAT